MLYGKSNRIPIANSIPMIIREKYTAVSMVNPIGTNCLNSNAVMLK